MILIAILTTALSLFYFLFLLRIRRGLDNLAVPAPSPGSPFVSVIIAARNEEEAVKTCLESVFLQDYPDNRYEVLVIDDGSEDQTAEIVESLVPAHLQLRFLSLARENEETGGRKPKAIATAIRESKGEIILTTDADCTVPPGWISGMVACFESSTSLSHGGSTRPPHGSSVAFVAGPVVEREGTRLLAALSRIEFLGLIATAAGLIGANRPIICNGANLAYRKSSFVEAGGFGENSSFCDDETLMQRINTRGIGLIAFSGSPRTIVTTVAPETARALWQQRLRWASKKGHYEDRRILPVLILLYLYFLALLLFFAAAVAQPNLLPAFLLLLLGKLLFEYSVLSKAATRFDLHTTKRHFFIAEFFHVPYIVAAGLLGQLLPLKWKGKKIRR